LNIRVADYRMSLGKAHIFIMKGRVEMVSMFTSDGKQEKVLA
jgi:hypothetical protein